MIDQKILSYTLFGALILLVIAMCFVAVFQPYGDLTRIKLYNIEIIQALLIPFAGIVGAVLKGMADAASKKSD